MLSAVKLVVFALFFAVVDSTAVRVHEVEAMEMEKQMLQEELQLEAERLQEQARVRALDLQKEADAATKKAE